jgi:hypothetical protein
MINIYLEILVNFSFKAIFCLKSMKSTLRNKFPLPLYVVCIKILSNFQLVQVVWNTEWWNNTLSAQRLSPRLFLAYLWCVLSAVLVTEQTCLSSLLATETKYYYKACNWQTWQYKPFNHYYTSAINCTGIQVKTLLTNFNIS